MNQENEAGQAFQRVLIINDDEVFNEITEYTLRKSAVARQYHSLLDPSEALDYLAACSEFPELILLDMNMPLMTGFQFLDEFIRRGYDRLRTMVVLFSSLIFDGHYERALAIGCVGGYYTKPIRIEDLKEIQTIFSQRFPNA